MAERNEMTWTEEELVVVEALVLLEHSKPASAHQYLLRERLREQSRRIQVRSSSPGTFPIGPLQNRKRSRADHLKEEPESKFQKWGNKRPRVHLIMGGRTNEIDANAQDLFPQWQGKCLRSHRYYRVENRIIKIRNLPKWDKQRLRIYDSAPQLKNEEHRQPQINNQIAKAEDEAGPSQPASTESLQKIAQPKVINVQLVYQRKRYSKAKPSTW